VADSQSGGVSLPTLILTGGPLDGTEFPLRMTSRDVSIGSSGGSDIQIALGNVDPLHAQLTFGEAGLTISDIGSATGTFLNGERVEDDAPLQDGDRICLGPPGAKESAKLLVRLPGAATAATPASAAPAASGGPHFLDSEPGPVLLGSEGAPPVSLSEEAPWPPPAEPPSAATSPVPASPPAPPEEAEQPFLSAEDVVVDGSAVGPPLGADEVPQDDALFAAPLPPVATRPTPPPPPPPAPPPAAAPPPPHPSRAEEPLTAPPPDEPPPPAEIPQLVEEPPPAVPPPPPRLAAPAPRGRRPVRRGRKSSPPVIPIVGAALLLLALGAGGWWFFLRPTPAEAPAPPRGPQAAAPAAAPATAPTSSEALHIEPDVALPGQAIEIRGQLPTGPVSVTIGGETAEVGETTAEFIRIVVPRLSLPAGQTVQVVAKVGSTTLPPLDLILGRLPLVLKITPPSGSTGDQVVLTGRGFDPQPAANAVTFGGAPALVLTASPTELTVVAPAPKTVGLPETPVIVSTGGRTSASDHNFSMTRSATSSFVPRFFAAPVTEYPGEDLAFVSTEIGPVLLLGGAEAGRSAATRAAEISSQLDQLVARARTRRVSFELRGRPEAVAVAGETGSLLAATAEDAAAYARDWGGGGRRGPRLTPAAITRYWRAILEDYFDLFLYRERPLEVASLDSRHRVFLNIYAEAARRSGSPGVPTSIVSPPSESMGEALRRAALVPAGGPAREEIAVEGRWQGTLEDPTTGSRRFEVSFDPAGKGLDGTIKTWRGSLELSSPLRDISFGGGTLRFTTDLQGTAHHFEGTLHDTTITGTATREGRPPVPFTVDLVE
jgi:pSer/pThr/pTyr-binding forkhead associated (FHA) protein